MAKQLQKIENYVVFSDTTTGDNLGEYAINHCVYTEETDRFIIKEVIDNGSLTILKSEITAGDWVDSGSVAFDERGVRDFLQANTGFKAAGGGSSVAPADAFSIDGIVTDFQYTQSQISNGAAIGNYISYGELFRIDCETKIESFDIKLNALGSTTTARLFSAIYKFDPVGQIYNLEVPCPGEFNVGSGGVVGWNKLTLPVPHTLKPGVYLKISTANENAGSVGYPNHDGLQLTGWIGTGTSQTPYRHLQFVAKFNYYYPAPSTIAISDLALNAGSTIMKVFNTTTN